MKVYVVLIFLVALSVVMPSPLPEVISKSSTSLPAIPASTGTEKVPAKPTKPPKGNKPDYFFIPPCVYCAREQKSAAEKHDSA
ncbi:hypothetical protein GHT06_008293 [Daphnia sinensis]|uniref:Uncharacterized protein n=1 Tax=Daphnia sinensis TaxID=1820382 RepID=A0AAD5Q201_9CRUS|nr:hypothetical protein GHT06_008293 [Daphnia sinensis]